MIHCQWKNSHDKKQAKGGLRHRLICKIIQKLLVMHRNITEENHSGETTQITKQEGYGFVSDIPDRSKWFLDVFWGEYAKFIGLYRKEMRIDGRVSKMLQFNVGPLHLAVEKWRSIKV